MRRLLVSSWAPSSWCELFTFSVRADFWPRPLLLRPIVLAAMTCLGPSPKLEDQLPCELFSVAPPSIWAGSPWRDAHKVRDGEFIGNIENASPAHRIGLKFGRKLTIQPLWHEYENMIGIYECNCTSQSGGRPKSEASRQHWGYQRAQRRKGQKCRKFAKTF